MYDCPHGVERDEDHVTGDTKSIQMVKRVIINRDTIGTNLVGIDKGVLKAVSKP